MSKTAVIVSVIFTAIIGILVTGAVTLFLMYKDVHDTAGRYESRIVGLSDQSRIRLGNHENTIMEMFQIDTAGRDHLKEIVTAAMQNRYGPNGSQAVMQMLQESQIPVDGKIREKITATIEAGRNHFTVSQEEMIKLVTAYRSDLNTLYFGTIARFAGFPKINLEKYKGVSTGRADTAFERGQEEGPLKIYEKK